MTLRFNKYKKGTRKFNVKVIAAGLAAITLIGIVGISTVKYSGAALPVFGAVTSSGATAGKNVNVAYTAVSGGFGDIFKFRQNAGKVKSLEKENEKLKGEVVALNAKLDKVSSLEELKKSLNFVSEEYKAKSIATSVVEKNDGNWYSSMVLGAGKKDGVKKNGIVVNGRGLVGLVYETSGRYSKAISLLDSKTSISFKLSNNDNSKGVITHNTYLKGREEYNDKGYLQGYMFDSSYDVVQGDVIVTSGMGIFPEGIPIGEVKKVIDDKNDSLKYVVVKPYVNFKNVDDVVVIEPRNLR